MSRYANILNWLSTTRPGGWLARTFAARLDPWVYRRTKGRLTSTGVLTIPQMILTTTGRKSGALREVQLGYVRDGGDFLVVASNFGRQRHPAWSHNLAAHPEASVYVDGRDLDVVARRVSDAEKKALWPRLVSVIPQFAVYAERTDRNIQVFRLSPKT